MRGYRATLLGAAGGLVVLAIVIAVGGVALAAVPIGPLRVVVGSLLLLFGLQWYRKGIVRVAGHGFAGFRAQAQQDGPPNARGIDWTAAFAAFKGVSLEGFEIAIIVVSFGMTARNFSPAILGGAFAIVLVAVVGFAFQGPLARIPRSFLQLVVGGLLVSFGTFWALEGLGVDWPQSDFDIVLLAVFYGLTAAAFIAPLRRMTRRTLQVVYQ